MTRILFSFIFTGILFGQVAPDPEPEKPDVAINFVDADDELLLNYSINLYAGYPIYTAEYFDSFDEISPILGLSVGTPLGIKAGLAYLTLNFEFINYKFKRTNEIEGEENIYEGFAPHLGFNTGMFINDLSLSFTGAMGPYHNDRYGFIGGVNVDLPYWGDFEVRGTLRFNAVPVTLLGGDDGSSGWLDLGISLGYEF